jgi:ADP-dependent NAD(P)H-hydrate dehydratase / NAD(P)H-hydrate epimerase
VQSLRHSPVDAAVLSVEQISALERQMASASPAHALMLQAAQNATQWLLTHVAHTPTEQTIVVLCGPGNNGGDGVLIAAALQAAGFDVQVIRVCPVSPNAKDAVFAWQQCRFKRPEIDLNVEPAMAHPFFDDAVEPNSVIIDALYGIGQTRPPAEVTQALLDWANRQPATRVAIDVPTGLDPETGVTFGVQPYSPFTADFTLTFIAPKLGLLTALGSRYCGQVFLDRLSSPEHLSSLPTKPQPSNTVLLLRPDPALFHSLLRTSDAHKGSHGSVLVVGGAPGMLGALLLAGRAALACGAGKVWLASLTPEFQVDWAHPALMNHAIDSKALAQCAANVVLIGPGLGQGKTQGLACLTQLLNKPNDSVPKLVIDADALNAVAADKKLRKTLAKYPAEKLLTPHPLEAARLLDSTVAEIQSNRAAAARQLSANYQATIVLKGAGTLVSTVQGDIVVLPVGGPILATAGTGDVLAGAIAALLAQGLNSASAAQCAVLCHGLGASELAKQLTAGIGLSANELIEPMRKVLNQLVAGSAGGI